MRHEHVRGAQQVVGRVRAAGRAERWISLSRSATRPPVRRVRYGRGMPATAHWSAPDPAAHMEQPDKVREVARDVFQLMQRAHLAAAQSPDGELWIACLCNRRLVESPTRRAQPATRLDVSTAATAVPAKRMGSFERNLTWWVFGCIAVGIALGQLFPPFFQVGGEPEDWPRSTCRWRCSSGS